MIELLLLPYLLVAGADTTLHATLEAAFLHGSSVVEACAWECDVRVVDQRRGRTYQPIRRPEISGALLELLVCSPGKPGPDR